MGKQFFFWFMDWLLDRLDEASTWRAIIIILGIAGVAIKPEMQDLIIQAGLLFFGGAHLMPDQLRTFERFKSTDGSTHDSAESSTDEQPTSEERADRFSKSMERSNRLGVAGRTEESNRLPPQAESGIGSDKSDFEQSVRSESGRTWDGWNG